MKHFIDKHQTRITGTISCFDRILFKGHLPLSWDGAMESFIARQGLKIKEFKDFVSRQSDRLKAHAKAIAERAERPYVYLNRPIRKEARARAIAEQDGITEGLVCILAAVEACQSFKIAYEKVRRKSEKVRTVTTIVTHPRAGRIVGDMRYQTGASVVGGTPERRVQTR